ncbi:MAG TPA: hypothetical protein VF044_10215 [Actinomycetota bacterium]
MSDEATGTPGPEVGRSSGWGVEEDEERGGFRWWADGPRGARRGHARTREEAEAAARDAERALSDERDVT